MHNEFINNWNGNNFPNILTLDLQDGIHTLKLWRYSLDGLEGEINLEDAPKEIVIEIKADTEEECVEFFKTRFCNMYGR